jgi:hypothetical protein
MTTANYAAISDDAVTVAIGINTLFQKEHKFPINLSSTVSVGHHTVLSFMIEPIDPSDLTFKISIINGNNTQTKIYSYTIQSNIWRSFHEVIPPNVLTATNNKLKVEVTGGSGQLRISDIVLLYQQG